MSGSPNLVQEHYAGRTDSADVNSAGTWKTADQGWTQAVDTNFRVRFTVANTGTGASQARAWQIYARLNSGSWFGVLTSTSIVKSVDASSSADNAAITSEQGSGAGTGTWVNGQYDENGGTNTQALTNGYYTEFEFGLQIVGADVNNNDTISLRLYFNGATLGGGYSADCTAITVQKATAHQGEALFAGVGALLLADNLLSQCHVAVPPTFAISGAMLALANQFEVVDKVEMAGVGSLLANLTRLAQDHEGNALFEATSGLLADIQRFSFAQSLLTTVGALTVQPVRLLQPGKGLFAGAAALTLTESQLTQWQQAQAQFAAVAALLARANLISLLETTVLSIGSSLAANLTSPATEHYLSIPGHADFAFGLGDFTIDAWAKPSA